MEVANLPQSNGPLLRADASSALQTQGTQEVRRNYATSAAIRTCPAIRSESCTSDKFFSSKKLGFQPRESFLGRLQLPLKRSDLRCHRRGYYRAFPLPSDLAE
eukprot:snap_masked-scaffold_28-processed-gene-2.17-mRNA-1 protein AED:1.00 eAED:1.00 QI:0/-1/0/0/-1/1/1/0/102